MSSVPICGCDGDVDAVDADKSISRLCSGAGDGRGEEGREEGAETEREGGRLNAAALFAASV